VWSATFSLGVLQDLARFGLLRRVDYLSRMGASGYTAGWLLAWTRACGYKDVEDRLAGKSGIVEATEIQGIRQATISLPSGVVSRPVPTQVWRGCAASR
jgi:Na+/serine symporter